MIQTMIWYFTAHTINSVCHNRVFQYFGYITLISVRKIFSAQATFFPNSCILNFRKSNLHLIAFLNEWVIGQINFWFGFLTASQQCSNYCSLLRQRVTFFQNLGGFPDVYSSPKFWENWRDNFQGLAPSTCQAGCRTFHKTEEPEIM